MLTAPGFAHTW